MLEKLSSLLDWASGLSYRQLAVVVALVLAAGLCGYLLLRPTPRQQGEFLPAQEEGGEPEAGMSGLTVHVAGAVVHPGVVLLDSGARVMDAVQQAGGPLPEADLDSLNLAQPVRDGQKITVPRKEESGGQGGLQAQSGDRVNVNAAGKEELERLPGIGPTLAQRILDYREANGGFRSVEELRKVSGIGPKKFEEIKELVEI